jgi:predicted nicotinamide N-methyase
MSDDEDEVEYEVETFQLRDFRLDITTVSYMPITKLMMLGQSSSEISGQKLWCGSLVVVEYILDHPELVAGRGVLELGAGTGVAGMVCQHLGASTVWLSDYDIRSLDHMKQDCQRNNINAHILSIDWFNFDCDEFFNRTSHDSPLAVIAGDVLYKTELLEPFFSVVYQLLTRCKDAKLILCHVPRAGVDQHHVCSHATSKGLVVDVIDRSSWKKGVCLQYSPSEDHDRAELYVISK